ncbi:hypothetical protein N7532_011639 [Penicillium argentinense]|uniref:Uncharacterized protein n=1 Tax=Penicillium argentinense TaxID=1131581 RepID=A0A9W9EIS0_9EURO|nr:uncharacterized protein N7532_011639 [Penicillium argentinense]KAJ5082596.1 hypothetical protein N7532_011639 [Penicillium argentinense]
MAKVVKCARANTVDDHETQASPAKQKRTVEQLHADVSLISRNDLNTFLVQAATKDADIAESSKTPQSSIWRSINHTRGMRGSAQYDVAFAVVAETEHDLKIVKQCGLQIPKTNLNGLSVLQKIGKSIALSSNDTLRHEVQKNFGNQSNMVDAMWEIVSTMSDEERDAVKNGRREEHRSLRLKELVDLAKDYCTFE